MSKPKKPRLSKVEEDDVKLAEKVFGKRLRQVQNHESRSSGPGAGPGEWVLDDLRTRIAHTVTADLHTHDSRWERVVWAIKQFRLAGGRFAPEHCTLHTPAVVEAGSGAR